MKLRELQNKRAAKIAEARQLLDEVEKRGSAMTSEESTHYDSVMAEVQTLAADIERKRTLMDAERSLEGGDGDGTRDANPDDFYVGMSARDIQRYSLVRAIRAAADAPKNPRAWDNAQLELEASRAQAERLGMDPQGFFVPMDVFNPAHAQRDLVVGTATAGGNLVSTDLLAQSFIEILRNRMLVRAAGATLLTGLVGDVAIPRQTGAGTAYWVAEGNAPTESQQTIDQLTMTPHTVGAFTDYSRKLLKQSSLDVENFVRTDLASILQIAIDYASLHGDHTVDANQPDGIAATSGIGSVVGGATGAAPDWADIVSLESEVSIDNADVGRLAYMTNPKVRGKLKVTPRVASTDSVMIWENGPNPLNGYPVHITSQVRSDITKTTTNLSAIFFGNWADLIIGMWGGLDVLVDPYALSTSGGVRVVALQDVDVGVRHAQSFAAMLDAITT